VWGKLFVQKLPPPKKSGKVRVETFSLLQGFSYELPRMTQSHTQRFMTSLIIRYYIHGVRDVDTMVKLDK